MWFLFGFITLIVFSASALYYRYYSRWKGEELLLNGRPYQVKVEKHKGKITGFKVGIDGVSEYDVLLKPENVVDRFFKRFGISTELQTGCHDFDDDVYVACDSSDIHKILTRDADVRSVVLGLLRKASQETCQVKRIRNRNGRLWIELDANNKVYPQGIADQFAEGLFQLKAALESFRQPHNRVRDPFVLKAVLILAISTGLAINGGVHLFRQKMEYFPHLADYMAVVWGALPYALFVLICLVTLVIYLLRGSSRAHLVLVEVLLVGFLGAWATSYTELVDLNTEMDVSVPVLHQTTVASTHIERRRTSKSRTTTHYFVEMTNVPEGRVPSEFEVSKCFYQSVSRGDDIVLTIRDGYLGYPWFESLQRKYNDRGC